VNRSGERSHVLGPVRAVRAWWHFLRAAVNVAGAVPSYSKMAASPRALSHSEMAFAMVSAKPNIGTNRWLTSLPRARSLDRPSGSLVALRKIAASRWHPRTKTEQFASTFASVQECNSCRGACSAACAGPPCLRCPCRDRIRATTRTPPRRGIRGVEQGFTY